MADVKGFDFNREQLLKWLNKAEQLVPVVWSALKLVLLTVIAEERKYEQPKG